MPGRPFLIAAAAVLAAAAWAPASAADRYVSVTIGTGGPTGVYFAAGNAICRLLHKEAGEGRGKGRKHGIRCSAPATNGSAYNIAQIRAGELDFGLAQSDWQYRAYHGSATAGVAAFAKLRAVFSLHPEAYHLVVAKDSGIDSWTGLKGRRFDIGNPGSGQRETTELLMRRYGTPQDFFGEITEMTSTEQPIALCDRRIDAYGYVVGVPSAAVAVAADGCGARLVGLDTAVVHDLVHDFPYYARTVIPRGTYKSTVADVASFAVMATLVTGADVPPDLVYELTRAVMENIAELRKLHPAFARLEPRNMIADGLSAPLHPGAARYYREKGWLN